MSILNIEFDNCLAANTSEILEHYVENAIGGLPDDEAMSANMDSLNQKVEEAQRNFFGDYLIQIRYLRPAEDMLPTLLYLKKTGLEINIVTNRPKYPHNIAMLLLCNWLFFNPDSRINQIYRNTFPQFRADLGIIYGYIDKLTEENRIDEIKPYLETVFKNNALAYINDIFRVVPHFPIDNNRRGNIYYCSSNPDTLLRSNNPEMTPLLFAHNGNVHNITGNLALIQNPHELSSYIAAQEL